MNSSCQNNKFTVVIPEHNRPEHLRRLLAYYLSYNISIIVADSSSKPFSYIKDYEGKIEYIHTPNMPLAEKINRIAGLIRTPYVFMCANDDFVIPETVNHITNFLDANLDYNSGQGIYFDFSYVNGSVVKSLRYANMINENLSEESPSDRVLHLMGNYFQYYYCVHRTETFKQIYGSVMQNGGTSIRNLCLLEVYTSMYPAIEGKHIVMPLLYAARENIFDSIASTMDGIGEIISKKKYCQEYESFTTLLSMHLASTEGVTIEKAKYVILESIQTYMQTNLPDYFSLQNNAKQVLKLIIKKIGAERLAKKLVRRKNKDIASPSGFEVQGLEHWNRIQDFILQFEHIYK